MSDFVDLMADAAFFGLARRGNGTSGYGHPATNRTPRSLSSQLPLSILWLKKQLLKVPGFHSIFHVAEDRTREIFTRELELHVIELENIGLASADRHAAEG